MCVCLFVCVFFFFLKTVTNIYILATPKTRQGPSLDEMATPTSQKIDSIRAGRACNDQRSEREHEWGEREKTERKEKKQKNRKNRMCRNAIFRNEKSIFALFLIPLMDLLTPTIYFQKAIIIQKARFSH